MHLYISAFLLYICVPCLYVALTGINSEKLQKVACMYNYIRIVDGFTVLIVNTAKSFNACNYKKHIAIDEM